MGHLKLELLVYHKFLKIEQWLDRIIFTKNVLTKKEHTWMFWAIHLLIKFIITVWKNLCKTITLARIIIQVVVLVPDPPELDLVLTSLAALV
jgi:hypothetical protein